MSRPDPSQDNSTPSAAAGLATPIAIVGIGCRFPGGAHSPKEFWRLLEGGVDAITAVPPDRWDVDAFYDPDPASPGMMTARLGGFLDSIDRFDAAFFGIAPREAAYVDPQHRLLLEVAWEALEDAREPADALAGKDIGVFIGISSHDYGDIHVGDRWGFNAYSNLGNSLSIAANRISYHFDFRGPSLSVDTACSASLVAVHLACQSMERGECSMALVGGVNLMIAPITSIGFSKAGMLSPDGRCKAFDARANGYVRAEGAGVVLLKPLASALHGGDDIYAIIRGTAINQDGRSDGITVPNELSQAALVSAAFRRAGISPGRAQYVEAHGTGTPVGDPIEARALGEALAIGRQPGHRCVIGSVKTNIGHLEAAAGIAGLIKVALALRHRRIPPNLHFQNPNPRIDFERLPLRVAQAVEPWPDGDGPAVAGINSFGFGGTNAHAILEEAPVSAAVLERTDGHERPYLLPVSARAPEALSELARRYRTLLADVAADPQAVEARSGLRDICTTAGAGRVHHEHRLALIGYSGAELIEQLDAFLAGEARIGTVSGRVPRGRRPRTVFVFCGQGSQWWAMGRQLLAQEPRVREMIETCDRRLLACGATWSLLEELGRRDEATSRVSHTDILQPAVFALQVSLAALWRSWGIQPDAVIGHSLGEVAAAHVAGVLDLDEAVRLIYHRGRIQHKASGTGQMLAVGLPVAAAERLLEREALAGRLWVAGINGPTSTTLAGEVDAVQEVAGALQARGVFARVLQVACACHTPHMDPSREELLHVLDGLRPQAAQVPLYSTVTGRISDGAQLGADYWWQNFRQPVRFEAAVDALIEDGYDLFLELGPHPVLARPITDCLARRGKLGTVLPSLRRHGEDRATLLGSLGALYVRGHAVDWRLPNGQGARLVRLPTYPWQRERHWLPSLDLPAAQSARPAHPLLGSRSGSAEPSWDHALRRRRLPYLDDHRIQGRVIYPGAAYVEMALAAAREAYGEGPHALEGVAFERVLVLRDGEMPRLRFTLDPAQDSFAISSRAEDPAAAWHVHARGRVRRDGGEISAEAEPLAEVRRRCVEEVGGEDCYREFHARGLDYGAHFRGIERVWRGAREALARVRFPEGLLPDGGAYQVHPCLLDTCFQAMVCTVPSDSAGDRTELYLPVGVDRIVVAGRPGAEAWCHARLLEQRGGQLTGSLRILADDGHVLAALDGVRCQRVGESSGVGPNGAPQLLCDYRWRPDADWKQPGLDANFLPTPSELVAQVGLGTGSPAPDVEARLRAVFHRLNAIAGTYVLDVFQRLGWEWHEGQIFSTDACAARLGVTEEHRRLLARLLGMLKEDGILAGEVGAWRVRRVPASEEARTAFEALHALHPEGERELVLLDRCARSLPQLLRGEIDGLDLLFPSGSPTELEEFYGNTLSVRPFNELVRDVVRAAAKRLPEGRQLRILEIGAGTGSITDLVLPELPAERTEYVFTDVSRQFLLNARKKYREFPFVRFELHDIDVAPGQQGFSAGTFDLILAGDVLHVARDLRQSLRYCRQLLAPGGLLAAVEPAPNVRIFDLIFGGTKGWGRFQDTDLRPASPLLSYDRWRDLLEQIGFTDIGSRTPPRQEAMQTVLLARAPAASEEHDAPVVLERPGSWLVLADRAGTGERLARCLRSRGESCLMAYAGDRLTWVDGETVQVDPAHPAELESVLTVLATGPGCRGIVHLWSLDMPSAHGATTATIETAQGLGCVSVMHLVQALDRVRWLDTPRLRLVTRMAQPVDEEPEAVEVAQAPLWGLGRVLMSEYSNLQCRLVDLGPTADPSDEARVLLQELWSDDREQEVAWRNGVRFVGRLVHRPPAGTVPARQRLTVATDQPFRLVTDGPGMLANLSLRSARRRAPGRGDVEIHVRAAGLNFKDVMIAMGVLPPEPIAANARETGFGLECAGVVVAVGEWVDGLRVGDRVVAIGARSIGSYVTTPAVLTVPMPAALGFEEAAGIPIVFATAYYGLHHLGRLARGEQVLIHAAAGGVGLAAVQIAQQAGAEIFATAGSAEKRAFLRSLGVQHVMDSRSLGFADEVVERTGGRGVDLVLNSLAGDALHRSVSILAPYGRFVELGKVDVERNSKLEMGSLKRNISFFVVDLSTLLRERPEWAGSLLREIMGRFADGTYHPVPHRVFPISAAADAFRHMAQARHIGKIVLSLEGQRVRLSPGRGGELPIHADGTYLVTGGLGGFGLKVAEWLAQQGARHLVLLGRSGAASEAASQAVQSLEHSGVEVLVARADVSREDEVARVLADVDNNLPPLRGIVHAAMVLDDTPLYLLNEERLRKVMGPKVAGAWNLHTQTMGRPLDFFVLFSSVTSFLVGRGQANYAAANAFLDAVSHYRRAHGLPSLTINWGRLTDVGYVAARPELAQLLANQGLLGISPGQALEQLDGLLREGAVQAGVVAIDWAQLMQQHRRAASAPRLSEIMPKDAPADRQIGEIGDQRGRLRARLRAALHDDRPRLLEDYLREQGGRVLGLPATRLDAEASLSDQGLDSLMAVELVNHIEHDLATTMPVVRFFGDDSIRSLAAQILAELDLAEGHDADMPLQEPVEPQQTTDTATNAGRGGRGLAARLANVLGRGFSRR